MSLVSQHLQPLSELLPRGGCKDAAKQAESTGWGRGGKAKLCPESLG